MSGLAFVVPGAPVPWQRARRAGNRYFTDPKVALHERRVRDAWREAGARHLGGGALVVRAMFHLPRPKAHFGTGRNDGRLKARAVMALPTGKPDVDNLLKVLDALNGWAWDDDAQIVRVVDLMKLYAPARDGAHGPRSYFEVWQVQDPEPPSMLALPVVAHAQQT